MAVGQTTQTTERYGCSITTVDPSQDLIEFVMKGDATNRRASIPSTTVAFRWPMVGEGWVVRKENNSWYLDGPQPVVSGSDTYRAVNPGDVVLNSPTGAIRVRGDTEEIADFDIDKTGVYSTPNWITLPYRNSYASQTGFRPGQYAWENGFVSLRGVVHRAGTWSPGENVAVLPAGFRPLADEVFTTSATDSGAGAFVATIEITTAGAVVIQPVTTVSSPATLTNLSLSGIRYQTN